MDIDQYAQGPQGDPFAPDPPAFYPPPPPPPPPPAPPKRKRRKPPAEDECPLCGGNEAENKNTGQPEFLLTCLDCRRSGHPSCLSLEIPPQNIEMLRIDGWRCTECKICEICQEKGDDERILFCDSCDRGWHMDCLQPPIEEAPSGNWFCPNCVQFAFVVQQPPSFPVDIERETSVASSSRPRKSTRKSRTTTNPGRFITNGSVNKANKRSRKAGGVGVVPKVASSASSSSSSSSASSSSSSDSESVSVSQSAVQRSRRRPRQRKPRKQFKLKLKLSNGSRKGKERALEEDDDDNEDYLNTNNKGLFDDILNQVDRDTFKTSIQPSDKMRFERSRVIAEQKLAPTQPGEATSEPPESVIAGPSSRPLRSSGIFPPTPGPKTPRNRMLTTSLSTSPGPSTPMIPFVNNTNAPLLRIKSIRFGPWEISTWYDAPFPEEYANIPDGRLWICEFCLKYMKSRFGAGRHRMKCKARHPPGDEIYRDGSISIFEVDGRRNKIYCQNLCLLSKLYLDHKSLFYDVEPFLFYVLTEVDDIGARFIGYFSKEKRSLKDWNLSCIMTLPTRQRQGWGGYLIDFSYLLSKKEKRTGSPEKPLSALGELGYKHYWTLALMRYLENAPERPRLEDISAATSMTLEDIYNTLVQQEMITVRETTPPPVRLTPGQSIKFPKGRKNGFSRRYLSRSNSQRSGKLVMNGGTSTPIKDVHGGLDPSLTGTPNGTNGTTHNHNHNSNPLPFIPPTEYEIHWDRERVDEYLRKWETKGYQKLRPEKLKWSPFLLSLSNRPMEVMKTEAVGAVGTEEMERVGNEEREKEKEKEKETETEVNGDVDGGKRKRKAKGKEKETERQGESDTPFSLFDDDDVVISADEPNDSGDGEEDPEAEDEDEDADADADEDDARAETPSLQRRRSHTNGVGTPTSLRRAVLEKSRSPSRGLRPSLTLRTKAREKEKEISVIPETPQSPLDEEPAQAEDGKPALESCDPNKAFVPELMSPRRKGRTPRKDEAVDEERRQLRNRQTEKGVTPRKRRRVVESPETVEPEEEVKIEDVSTPSHGSSVTAVYVEPEVVDVDADGDYDMEEA